MNSWRRTLATSPALVRVLPFVVFVLLTALQGQFGEDGRYWIYLGKTVVGAWLIWVVRPLIAELKLAFSWEAIAAGVAVFLLWVGLDGLYPSTTDLLQRLGIGETAAPSRPWNPLAQFREHLALGWMFVAVRFAGSVLVVPFVEEVFYRSFLYRWIVRPDFEEVPLHCWSIRAMTITALVFGFAHREWLPGILCAVIYQGLVLRKGRLGDAIVAHAITNLLLGVWVVWRPAWQFW